MKQWLAHPWLGPLLALFAVYGLFAWLAPDTFVGAINLMTMARQTVVVALAAVGMTYIILLGGIDLSVGSSVALTTVLVARALQQGAPPLLACALGILGATLCGLLNGAVITAFAITPFIATLGSMSVLRGAAKGLSDEQKIDADPRGLEVLMAAPPPGHGWLPPGVWILALVALLAALVLRYSVFGRHVVAVGSNELTARLCGVPVRRVKIGVYTLAGALAGLAGVMEYSTLTVGDPTDSLGLELEVIAAVVIGGGSLAGGQGSIPGAMLGALLMTEIKTGCTHVGLPNWVQEILTGVIIVAAVALDKLRKR
ncbi:MAG TPA: ABC transporter permease [Polyangiaceae bacterium]|nr:ABC transporter permease [Polyangiaceae bacterium]